MTDEKIDPGQYGFPPGLSQPAMRALIGAGYTNLPQVAAASEKELLNLHGFGPKGIRILRAALAAEGLSFAATAKKGNA